MGAVTALFTGGCRSGKSALAQAFVQRHKPPYLFIATAQSFDEEMAERIARHRADRGPDWNCLEAPLDLPGALERVFNGGVVPAPSAVLIDCVTVWLGNLMANEIPSDEIYRQVDDLAALAAAAPVPLAIVTNEVGSGIVPAYPMGREFRDIAGTANQRLASVCSHVVLAVAGLPMPVKPYGGPLP